MTMITAARLAATEYAVYHSPPHTRRTAFGWFVHIPHFPGRYDANQLFDIRLHHGDVDRFFETLEDLYAQARCPFRRITSHDEQTAELLLPVLRQRGWSCQRTLMLVHQTASRRPINPDLDIKSVPIGERSDDCAMIEKEVGTSDEGLSYRLSQEKRLGGQVTIGYFGQEPAGHTGWFIVDGIARFRHIATRPRFRGCGVATTLIDHVQNQRPVRAADALCIHVGEDGPAELYQQCGYRHHSTVWEGLLVP